MRILAIVVLVMAFVPRVLLAQLSATISGERVNVRQTATVDAAIVTTLRKGVSVKVLERTESWAKIESGTTTGWVRSSSLTFAAEGATPAPAPTTTPGPTAAPKPTTATPAPTAKPASATATRRAATPATKPATTAPAPRQTTASAPAATSRTPAAPAEAPTQATPTPPPVEREAPVSPKPEESPASTGGRPRSNNNDTGFRLGLLGSATPAPEVVGVKTENHLAALPLVLIQGNRLGVYLAPDIGTGAGYRSLMLGGGLSLRLITIGRLQLRAMGGMTTYKATLPGTDSVSRSLNSAQFNAASFGGLATLRVVGPTKVAFRGQQVLSVGEPVSLRFRRYAVGLIF